MRFIKEYRFYVGGVLLVLLILSLRERVAFNLSPSLPAGVYLVGSSHQGEFDRGDIVLFYDEQVQAYATGRRYVRPGQPIGKRIGAIEGDIVRITRSGILINGRQAGEGTPRFDSSGRDMNLFLFDGVVPNDMLLLFGDARKSFDSRYFGFVSEDQITAVLYPVLTW